MNFIGNSDAYHMLATPRGLIKQSYDVSDGAFTSRFSAPAGALDVVTAPTFGRRVKVRLDGRLVWNGNNAVGDARARTDGDYVYVDAPAGAHELTAQP